MDAQRFDTLAKLVSNGRGSRRRVLTAPAGFGNGRKPGSKSKM
jgi:hypothetical protein